MGIIGEAVKRLSQEFREGHPDIDWRGWAGLRDILVHAYDSVQPEALWAAVENEVADLERAALAYLDELVG